MIPALPMHLSSGTRLGPYEIVAPAGAGGMGEVYRARDTRLGRDVAVKVLPTAGAADPDLRLRFEREARTVSQLNHPHICTLFDIGEHEGIAYLVMEYLEGETLSARLKKGPLPPNEALGYAIEVADALDKAHRQGIVHRDLKPANVMVTKAGEGRSGRLRSGAASRSDAGEAGRQSPGQALRSGPAHAKLLDFGLAKLAAAPALGTLETVLASGISSAEQPSALTAQGTLLGTFQYMAPEQLEGLEADARSDIWAFGCVLYEMLSGARPFDGRTQASLIGAILEREPPAVGDLQPLTPPALRRVIHACLAKHPDDRIQTAHDLLLQLRWIEEAGAELVAAAPAVARRKGRDRLLWLGGGLLCASIGTAAGWYVKPAAKPAVVTRFAYSLPEGQAFTRTGRRVVAISPEGTRIAYIANKQIYLRRIDELDAAPVPGTSEDSLDVTFSPDGQWLAYFVPTDDTRFTLKKIGIAGGTPVTLATTGWPYGISWSGGNILIGQNDAQARGIQSIPDSGGTPSTIAAVDPSEVASAPQSVDAEHVIFSVRSARARSMDDSAVVIQRIGEGQRRVLVKGATAGRLADNRRLVYARDGALFGVPFDPAARAVSGGAVPFVQNVQIVGGTGIGQFDVAETGALVYVPGASDTGGRALVWTDRAGKEDVIPAPSRQYWHPRISPDGTRIVVAVETPNDGNLWVWDLDRRTLTRITFRATIDSFPVWTPDGRSVIYASTAPDEKTAILRVNADGTGTPVPVLADAQAGTAPESISPDGKLLVLRSNAGLLLLPLTPGAQPRPLGINGVNGMISPDGRWIAYESRQESGDFQVYVRPFPDVHRGRWQVSTDGAESPFWSRSARELFFPGPGNVLFAVSVAPGPVFGTPQRLFEASQYVTRGVPGGQVDAFRDDRRFVMMRSSAGQTTAGIVVVTNWFKELNERVR